MTPSSLHACFLVGCTATGKTETAHRIAEKRGWYILSADSMCVYRDMNVGTAKPTPDQRRRVCYFGIGLVAPDEPFSAWDYRNYALGVLSEAASRYRKVIVAGGTGLYVKGLIDGLADVPGPDPEKRRRWLDIAEKEGVEPLCRALEKSAPKLYETLSDKSNPRRLVRALEMAEAGITEPPRNWSGGESADTVPVPGLSVPDTELKERIDDRVRLMFDGGLMEEARCLSEKYENLGRTASHAIGYREALDCLAGKCTKREAVEKTSARTRQLARRQKTWFRHQAKVKWIQAGSDRDPDEIAGDVCDHWDRYGASLVRE
ncbi:MAG: tRNA (adenosine(37)-N6)-dimethylallyltransferase MiaA [Kiritimatiellia bacterium]